ncbi:MAG TPA: hypothetical protein VKH81_12360 [Candidatus Angelobacter sp.]|nr:hypothetical protein [Candidatus Angelobacter sp.]
MTHLRGTTRRQQAVARQIELWIEPATLPAPVRTGAAWITGFFRAATETVSPAAVREFLQELYVNDRVLALLSWALMAVIPVFAAMAFLASGSAAINPWIKPIKFSISFSTFASTVSLFLLALRIPEWQLKWARRLIAGSVALEILSLAAQAWRSAYAAGSHTLLDGVLAQMTNSMVMINTAIVTWMLALFFLNRVHVRMVDRPMVAAIRYSVVIFLLGNAIGGYMLARGSHTVGASDSAPGLPFLNWSTIGGDLRIAHFIAIHAIQIVPLFAYVLAQMAPIPTVRQRRFAVAVVALMVAVAVGGTFVQAALGMPLLPIH